MYNLNYEHTGKQFYLFTVRCYSSHYFPTGSLAHSQTTLKIRWRPFIGLLDFCGLHFPEYIIYIEYIWIEIHWIPHFPKLVIQVTHCLVQGSPHSVLEGRCPAEFISNLPQHTCLEVSGIPSKTLISLFRCVWLGLELNSAGHRPSRNKFGDPWSSANDLFSKLKSLFAS